MPTQLIVKEWAGFPIEFEEIGGQLMANATSMCAAFKKRPQHWLDLGQTKRYLSALQTRPDSPASLVETRNTGQAGTGTWIHEKLILKLAQWLSVEFELQCDEWVAELLRTGKVELKPQTQLEMLLAQVTQAVEMERRQTALEAELGEVKTEVKQLAHTIVNQIHELNHFTVAGYYAQRGVRAPHNNRLKELGKQAATLSRLRSVTVAKAPHEKYGSVNVYRDDILAEVTGI